ncbi:hypothetical protein ACQKNB_18070 [Lysinibacillus xylanilyticus]|uniref:hypothetical protein n=1 Tax=Lysinibacillus xylanilyticus TaxID=582475 RepID=UPI003D01B064
MKEAEENAGKIFSNIEVLAENLTHDQARSIEGALIRKRLRENIDKFKFDDSIMKRLDKSDLLNKNRGRVKERWISDNPLKDLKDLKDLKYLKDLKDKMYDNLKKLNVKDNRRELYENI